MSYLVVFRVACRGIDTAMIRQCYILLLAACILLAFEINADPVDSCYMNGTRYEMWQSWNADAGGECVQYKCTRSGIAVKRCVEFLDSMTPDRFQGLLDLLDGTNCTFVGADNEKAYPECCNKIMCLHESYQNKTTAKDVTTAAD